MIMPEHIGRAEQSGMPTLADLRKSEWSLEFETLMRNRLIMGYYRYGSFATQNRTTKEMLDSIIYRAEQYMKTGNDELLVDIANLSMKEFAVGEHPNKHFESEDDGSHVGEEDARLT